MEYCTSIEILTIERLLANTHLFFHTDSERVKVTKQGFKPSCLLQSLNVIHKQIGKLPC